MLVPPSGSSDDEASAKKDLHPISYYIDDRAEMIKQVDQLEAFIDWPCFISSFLQPIVSMQYLFNETSHWLIFVFF